MNRTRSVNAGSRDSPPYNISIGGPPLHIGIGGKRCVRLVLLSIMSLNKHLQTNVLLPHAAESDETAVRKHPYPSWVSSNWRSTLPPLALFDRYCSITTPVPNTDPARQYTLCNYNSLCCYTMIPHTLHNTTDVLYFCVLSVSRHKNKEHACGEPACDVSLCNTTVAACFCLHRPEKVSIANAAVPIKEW